uniref:Uncharacterized protein n=1 Tax=Mycena chlorophos TaxID=658473 RepID=A0ABQ0MDN1_MYCCL|nr:predicted protein [Mycena chlorophos]
MQVRRNRSAWQANSWLGTLHTLTLIPSFDVSPGAWLALDHDLYESFTQLRKVEITVDGPFVAPVRDFVEALPCIRSAAGHALHDLQAFAGARIRP